MSQHAHHLADLAQSAKPRLLTKLDALKPLAFFLIVSLASLLVSLLIFLHLCWPNFCIFVVIFEYSYYFELGVPTQWVGVGWVELFMLYKVPLIEIDIV